MIYVVSGSGGGSADKNPYAVVTVTYPAGSICSITNGAKTLKAPNTLGAVTFFLPSGGAWTLSCNNGLSGADYKEVSKSLSPAQGECMEVSLSYLLYLIQNSTPNPDYVDKSATFNAGQAGSGYGASWKCTIPIDLTPFTTLTVNYTKSGNGVDFGVCDENSTYLAKVSLPNGTNVTQTLDISSLSLGYLRASGYVTTGISVKFLNVYLE